MINEKEADFGTTSQAVVDNIIAKNPEKSTTLETIPCLQLQETTNLAQV